MNVFFVCLNIVLAIYCSKFVVPNKMSVRYLVSETSDLKALLDPGPLICIYIPIC